MQTSTTRPAGAFDTTVLFESGRFPNLLVALDGTLVATWGQEQVVVRRSRDGGESWEAERSVGPGMHGGGALVDEVTGDLLLFAAADKKQAQQPAHTATQYRSRDGGCTWTAARPAFGSDSRGNVPALHMHEHGITLQQGPHAGRLLRPARVYGLAEGYNSAFYSDDHGQSWQASEPFPVDGTGEAAVAELQDGTVFYSSRRHWFAPDEPWHAQRLQARSHDGGHSYGEPTCSAVLPDGPRYRGQERRETCYNNHFGLLGGLVRLPLPGRDVLLYSNLDEPGHARVGMSVWASFDGGTTWPAKRLVHTGAAAYSSLNAGRPGTAGEGWVFLQFEEHRGPGRLARFNLPWLLAGEATGDGVVPEWAEG